MYFCHLTLCLHLIYTICLSCSFELVSTLLSSRKLKVNKGILYNSIVFVVQKSLARLFIVTSCCVLFTDGVFALKKSELAFFRDSYLCHLTICLQLIFFNWLKLFLRVGISLIDIKEIESEHKCL